MSLYDYQLKLKADVYAAMQSGAVDVCAVLPTGGGKSHVMSDVAADYDKQGEVSCIMAHRTELTSQMSMHVARRGIYHRIIAPKPIVTQIMRDHREEFNGRSFINPDARCHVGSVATILARKTQLQHLFEQCVNIQTDEGHHQLKINQWGQARDLFKRATGIGWTASPVRGDGMGLGRHHDGFYDVMVQGPDMRSLITMGRLTDYQLVLAESDLTMEGEEPAPSGDYSPAKLKKAAEKSRIVGDVVREYCKHALGKRAICFATDVDKAREIAGRFNDIGIAAAAVDANTPREVRTEYIRRFKTGRLTILVNVDLFDEGFDVPACEVVIMARPTASLSKYLQMFGRALRTLAGKLYGLIIDHVGNWKRHGFPDKFHFWSLDRRDRKPSTKDPELIDKTSCTTCTRPYDRALVSCPWCGATPALPEPGSRTIEMVDGDLVLLSAERLAEMRAALSLPDPSDVRNRVERAAGAAAGLHHANKAMAHIAEQKRLSGIMDRWADLQFSKGRSQREAEKRFFLASGVDVLSALALSRPEMEKLATMIEGWMG